MSTGREGHRVLAEPLNSLKYNQPLSLLGQLPGRAETLLSPSWGSATRPGTLVHQLATRGWQDSRMERGHTEQPSPSHKERSCLKQVSQRPPRPAQIPTAAFSKRARGHSC